MDWTIMEAVGDAALGVQVTSHWGADFDNPANKEFVEAFRKKYNRVPTYYASQGYDTALAIGAALKGSGGTVADTEKFRQAMLKADFASVRGAFKFGPNQHPVQDWYLSKVERGADGKPTIRQVRKVLSNHSDAYAAQCKL
jgi:branched-chain amino acid transport system substrate-binding protein